MISLRERIGADSELGAFMQFGLITADGGLFGFDIWDWSMILGGSLLVSLVALLV
jgi:hypothetical protein